MTRLTRQVRFALSPPPAATPPSPPGSRERFTSKAPNGFAGHPVLGVGGKVGIYLQLSVTVEGDLEPQSQYLVNIKTIDDAVRQRVIPHWQVSFPNATYGDLLKEALDALSDAFQPARVARLDLAASPFQTYSLLASEPSMIRLSQMFEFSAAHRLHNPNLTDAENVATFGKCNNPLGHGHNYVVQVTVRTSDTPDVVSLEAIVDEHLIRHYDHKHLNLEVEEFKAIIPSVENIAKAAFTRLKPHLPTLAGVTVWETPKTWAEYSEP